MQRLRVMAKPEASTQPQDGDGKNAAEGIEDNGIEDDTMFAKEAATMQAGSNKEGSASKAVEGEAVEVHAGLNKEESVGNENAKKVNVGNNMPGNVWFTKGPSKKDENANVCYICKQKGHIKKNCPKFTCFNCEEHGHTRAKCMSEKPRALMVPNGGNVTKGESPSVDERKKLTEKVKKEASGLEEALKKMIKDKGEEEVYCVISLNGKNGQVEIATYIKEDMMSEEKMNGSNVPSEYRENVQTQNKILEKFMDENPSVMILEEEGSFAVKMVVAIDDRTARESVIKDLIYMAGGKPSAYNGKIEKVQGENLFGANSMQGKVNITMSENDGCFTMVIENSIPTAATAIASMMHCMEINIHVKEVIEKAKYDQIPMYLQVPDELRMNDERIKSIVEAMIKEVKAEVNVTGVEKDKNDPEMFHIIVTGEKEKAGENRAKLLNNGKRLQKMVVSKFNNYAKCIMLSVKDHMYGAFTPTRKVFPPKTPRAQPKTEFQPIILEPVAQTTDEVSDPGLQTKEAEPEMKEKVAETSASMEVEDANVTEDAPVTEDTIVADKKRKQSLSPQLATEEFPALTGGRKGKGKSNR